MSDLVHITQINATKANIDTDMDPHQIGIRTDLNVQGYRSFMWEDSADARFEAAALNEDAIFDQVTVGEDLLIAEYMKLSSATDNYVRLADGEIDLAVEGTTRVTIKSWDYTDAQFGATGAVYIGHYQPEVYFNAYSNSGEKYGAGSSDNYAASIRGDMTNGGFVFKTSAAAGDADDACTLSTRMLMDKDGNVVIGTTPPAPDTLLHLWATSAGTVSAADYVLLTLEQLNGAYVQFLTGTSQGGGLIVGDENDNDVGQWYYSNSLNAWKAVANATVALYLTQYGIMVANGLAIYAEGGSGIHFHDDAGAGWQLIDGGHLVMDDGIEIRAGGSAGLRLEDDGGNGVTIADGGDLVLDDDLYSDGDGWQSFSPTISGWAATPTSALYYKRVGNLVFVSYSITGTGDGNQTYFELPYNPLIDALLCRGAAGTGTTDDPTMMTYMNVAWGWAHFSNAGIAGSRIWGDGVAKWVCGQFWYEAADK